MKQVLLFNSPVASRIVLLMTVTFSSSLKDFTQSYPYFIGVWTLSLHFTAFSQVTSIKLALNISLPMKASS